MANAQVLDPVWLDEAPTTPWHPRGRPALRVEVNAASESQFFAGLTGDVLAGGVFVQTYRALSIGQRVEMVLVLPEGEVEACGVVQWRRDAGTNPGFGVAFEPLAPSAQARITEFCRSRPPLYHDIDAN